MRSVRVGAGAAILERDPTRKALAAHGLNHDWKAGRLTTVAASTDALVPIDLPRVQGAAAFVHASKVPKRRLGSPAGRAAMLHAVAHIEWTAIDLALDHAHRFADMPDQYYADWLRVASEEALHFSLLRARLRGEHGIDYGHLPVHAGQWAMAERSGHDVLVRMALVPRVNEARGLDVAPGIGQRLANVGDDASAAILRRIHADEVGHVAIGDRWFRWCCAQRCVDAEPTFAALLVEHDVRIHPPVNVADRVTAGFTPDELADLGLLDAR